MKRELIISLIFLFIGFLMNIKDPSKIILENIKLKLKESYNKVSKAINILISENRVLSIFLFFPSLAFIYGLIDEEDIKIFLDFDEPIRKIIIAVLGAIIFSISFHFFIKILAYFLKFLLKMIDYLIIFIFSSYKYISKNVYNKNIIFFLKIPPYIFPFPFFIYIINYLVNYFDFGLTFQSYSTYKLIITLVLTILLFIFYPNFISFYNRIVQIFIIASRIEKRKWEYVRSFPNVYCLEHLCRPKKVRKAFFYNDILCKSSECSQEFKTGIKKVIGLIGYYDNKKIRDKEDLYLNLWSEKDKKAISAEIDSLEILDKCNINYDWAVNAIILEMSNNILVSEKGMKKIPVVIKGNPSISDDIISLLSAKFKKVNNIDSK